MTQSSKDRSGAVAGGPYRINAAAELCGVPAATLRAWERRYGVPVPRRTTTAYRLYSAEDIALIRRMNELVVAGVAPAEAARTALASSEVSAVIVDEADAFELARERLLAATHRWDGTAIDDELARLSLLMDAQTLYQRVVQPLLIEVGERWKQGALSVAQEHLLSEKLELTLRAALRVLERNQGPLVIIACVAEENHVLGLLGAGIRLAANGYRVITLGSATPPDALADAVRNMAPRLVGLSATRLPAQAKALFKSYAKAVGPTPWVLGGAAADAVATFVSSAGGSVALGGGPAWSSQARDWLRGSQRT
jgi:DNA-binding transcriptional MerR regulator